MTSRSLYSLHLSTARSWRGGENQIFLLASGLKARGQKVLVVAPEKTPLADRCREAGLPACGLTTRGALDPLASLKLLRLLRREKPDVLHLHDGHAVLQGQLVGRAFSRQKLKVVAHRRTAFPLKGRWKYCGRLDRIVAISRAVQADLCAAGVPAGQIRLVYSGLEFSKPWGREHPEALRLRESCRMAENELLLAHAGALSAEKRQLDIIAALGQAEKLMKPKRLPGVHLAIAGSGPEEPNLRQAVEKLALGEKVHFLGFVRDLRPLWAASDLAVFASAAEGLCTALVEAQAAGLPALASRVGGMPEVVAEEETGLLFEAGDQKALAAGIASLCSDQVLRARMGRQAGEHAREKFSAAGMVESILKLYRELWAE